MSVVGVLVATRAVISDPDRWCKHVRRLNGRHCALGAFEVALPREYPVDSHPAVAALAEAVRQLDPELYDGSGIAPWIVANFNNQHSHAELMHAFDIAIASEKAKRTLVDIKAKVVLEPELVDG